MKKILIIDIETTGFLKQGGKIVEIGIVELDLDNGEKRILFDSICYENGISREECDAAWIIENSTLTTEQIRTSKNLNILQKEIQRIIFNYPLGATAFNNTFDFDFLKDRGFMFPKELPCPMKLSTDICKIPHRADRYGKIRSGNKWPSVMEAYKYFFPESEYIEQHRGADDAFHEANIVQKLYELSIFKLD
jgi:DNA polymerase-3 subunit epsilon